MKMNNINNNLTLRVRINNNNGGINKARKKKNEQLNEGRWVLVSQLHHA